jgi:L-xylulokinase
MEKKKYMLCIDNGLSFGKAALVDYKGNITGIVSFKTEIINDNDYSEIDMDLLYRKTSKAIQEVIQKSYIASDDIVSIGISGHGGGIYLIDRYGTPVRNAITSMDSRGESLIYEWKRNGIDCYSKTYTNMWNGQAIPLLFWIKKYEIDNYKRASKVFFCKDWIKFKLTGQITTDYTDASNAGLINLESKNYDSEIYKMYSLEDVYEKLPKLTRSNEIVGYVTKEAAESTGLREGIPVIG